MPPRDNGRMVAEIVGCDLPRLWLKQDKWLLVQAAATVAFFAWLQSLHPTAAGRVYATYGGVYIGVAIGSCWSKRVRPAPIDWIGVAVSLLGMANVISGPR